MKLKSIIKYQFSEYKITFLIYYFIIIMGALTGTVMVASATMGSVTVNGAPEASGMIVFFIIAICVFGENFNLLIQHGNSRKSIFQGRIITTLIVGAILGVIDQVVLVVLRFVFRDHADRRIASLLEMMFPEYMGSQSGFMLCVFGFLCSFIGVAACSMVGNLIATGFYRANRMGRIAIAAGIPIFTFLAVPLTMEFFAGTRIVEVIINIILVLTGMKSGNPFYFLGTLLGVFILSSLFSYLIIRKTNVRPIY